MKEIVAVVENGTSVIAGNMMKQSEGNREILSRLQETMGLARDVENLAMNLNELSAQMMENLQSLSSVFKETTSLSQEMKNRNARVREAMEELNKLSEKSKELNDVVNRLLGEFKI